MRHIKLLVLIVLIAAVPTYAAKIKNGEDLAKSMHKKYKNKWYKTLTFVQKNTQTRRDGTVQKFTWYEAMSVPGRLRIDYDPMENNTGLMFIDGKQYQITKGKIAKSQPTIHPLMVLGFDVYRQPVETTIRQLKELKFDLSIIRKDRWNGRSVYVVGAKKGDLKTLQFWIDKKRKYLVKTIQPAGPDGKSTQEIQFNKYQKVKGGGWIAPEVAFLFNGKQVFLEEYTNMRFNVDLNENLFDPNNWSDADKDYYKVKR